MIGVTGRRPDEIGDPFLTERQKMILLRRAEAMHLIGEQQRRAHARLVGDLADIGDIVMCRMQRPEILAQHIADGAGNRGLSKSGRAVKDDAAQPPSSDAPTQHRSLAENLLLTDDVVERRRTQFRRERHGAGTGCGIEKIGHGSLIERISIPTAASKLLPAGSGSSTGPGRLGQIQQFAPRSGADIQLVHPPSH
ncbi:hypothetical protein D3C71_538320 [compost metagenome]